MCFCLCFVMCLYVVVLSLSLCVPVLYLLKISFFMYTLLFLCLIVKSCQSLCLWKFQVLSLLIAFMCLQALSYFCITFIFVHLKPDLPLSDLSQWIFGLFSIWLLWLLLNLLLMESPFLHVLRVISPITGPHAVLLLPQQGTMPYPLPCIWPWRTRINEHVTRMLLIDLSQD